MYRVMPFLLLLFLAGCANGERVVEVRADVPVCIYEHEKALAWGKPARVRLQADGPHELTIRTACACFGEWHQGGCEVRREGLSRREQTVTVRPVTSSSRVATYIAQCLLMPLVLLVLPVHLSVGSFCDLVPDVVEVVLGGAP